ncbi:MULTISPECIES: CHAP domain-containing protein [unclassified Sphingobium]|uniref:CHAP domain-containing protein n=1 Tax=unclassified Sphingobium TaxID=2611147 RepID=UPI00077067AE|nr:MULTISPECIES: CHAP domain-containing protein [unclassified Sphingobium]AMK24617.1 CHAP domain-containing protein [Sphingobium sp. TKS]NML88515.1 CHAP domain-containing protein [Sphingobium sp. TB-6]
MMRWAALLLASLTTTPVLGATVLQCVPYARIVSGVQIYGDALTWWDQAENHYRRGHMPRKGAVLAFRPMGPMVLGHVAVVSRVLDDRRVLIRHANWSVPGAIEEDVLAIDVSEEGDWSEVRVWHSPTNQMGARSNPTFGFIYPDKPQLREFRPDPALGDSLRFASMTIAKDDPAQDAAPSRKSLASQPRLALDLHAIRYADATPSARSLRDIIADVKRDAALR